jgi:hypothetical protein
MGCPTLARGKAGLCTKHSTKKVVCSDAGCTNAVHSNNKCQKHQDKKCNQCTNRSVAKGVCAEHGAHGTCACGNNLPKPTSEACDTCNAAAALPGVSLSALPHDCTIRTSGRLVLTKPYTQSPRLVLPVGLHGIQSSVFAQSLWLVDLVASVGMRTIDDRAFMGCIHLETVQLPADFTHAGTEIFKDCVKLRSVQFHPATACTTIAVGMFDGCTSLAALELPPSVHSVQELAFARTALVQFVLPDTVQQCSPEAFAGCDSLTQLTVSAGCGFDDHPGMFALGGAGITTTRTPAPPHTLDQIGYCGKTLMRVPLLGPLHYTIPVLIRRIEPSVFACREWLETIDLGTCTDLQEAVFAECINLVELNLSLITDIPEQLCAGCVRLTTVHYNRTLNFIAVKAFADCHPDLARGMIVPEPGVIMWCAEDAFSYGWHPVETARQTVFFYKDIAAWEITGR